MMTTCGTQHTDSVVYLSFFSYNVLLFITIMIIKIETNECLEIVFFC